MSPTATDQIMTEALWHIDAKVEELGWDQDPSLYVVQLTQVGDAIGMVALTEVPAWGQCLNRMGNGRHALEALVQVHRVAALQIRPPAIDDFYGVALVTEIWQVTRDRDEEFDATTKKLIAERRMGDVPGRVEARMILCVSASGNVASLNHERGGIVQVEDGSVTMRGALVDLMTELISIMEQT